MKILLDVSDREVSDDQTKKTRLQKEKYWNECINHPCTKFCLEEVTKTFTKYVPLKKK